MRFPLTIATALLVRSLAAQEIINGQIFTPGIAIIDSPQPNTPLGGDTLHIAIDVSSNGQLQLPPYPTNAPSALHNITLFLSSYTTGKNLTISDGTASSGEQIMAQEPGSTVKHINWIWPSCLVGNGAPNNNDSARGAYNISIHQNFRLNGTDLYTIFDLPIKVTNLISESGTRPSCDGLNNPLLDQADLTVSANSFTRIPGTAIEGGKDGGGKGNGLGGERPEGTSKDGLGGAEMVSWRAGGHWVWIGAFGLMFWV
ncbi:hypothetical protein VTL71DRAFT_9662 [Oculimacula yallundae]|uniref:Uncharacterized protein n=1 Tax=Oculimacula yallundae TaxID=86028 RepID=A0ABR4BRG1_9HELO